VGGRYPARQLTFQPEAVEATRQGDLAVEALDVKGFYDPVAVAARHAKRKTQNSSRRSWDVPRRIARERVPTALKAPSLRFDVWCHGRAQALPSRQTRKSAKLKTQNSKRKTQNSKLRPPLGESPQAAIWRCSSASSFSQIWRWLGS
jgi:hypothetical protein